MKRRKTDQLAQDLLAARAAGLSYGKCKALCPTPPAADEPQKFCTRCGKPIYYLHTGGGRNRKRCIDCTGQ